MRIKTIKKRINDIILCIRFPFLYPRNRFTGLHYNNWTIIDFHRNYYKFLKDTFILNIVKESELLETSESKPFKYFEKSDIKRAYRLFKNSDSISIIDINNNNIRWDSKITDILESGSIIKFSFINDRETLVVSDDAVIKEGFCRVIFIDRKETILKTVIKFLDWVNDYPLQILHCIPKSTELDAMEPGWRKVFGIKICKEFKKQLKKEGNLYKFRIYQIKEKWGLLRIYHNGSQEIENIINKYEDLSEKICICCGKPATKMTKGWISYYCDSCYPKNKEESYA